MKTLVVSSLRSSAGKTSVIIGLARALQQTPGYMKPFGDRLLYSKKRLWDYDAALVANIFSLQESPDEMSIGFDHSKLRYMYDDDALRQRVQELARNMSADRNVMLVEGGKSLSYGTSVSLDALSLARTLQARLVFVISGDDDTILDDIMFVKHNVELGDVELAGVVVNKVRNVDDFAETCGPELKDLGIRVLGIIPHHAELTYFSLRFLADRLFAKVVAAEAHLDRTVKNIFIGAMSGNVAVQKPFFKKEAKLIITGGDRSDMILAALDSDAAGIVLTNNILPPANIIARAEERGTPLLLVAPDTFHIASQIDRMEPLLTRDEAAKIGLLEAVVRDSVDVEALLGS